MLNPDSQPVLDAALFAQSLDALDRADPEFAAARARLDPPPLRRRAPGFATLLDIIIAQQVSTASAGAIRGRLRDAVAPLTPDHLLAASDDTLRAVGLSRPKIGYVRAVAAAIVDGRLDLARVARAADEDAIAELVQLRGIGRWAAEIYLLFALGRPDIWPADDLAIQLALQRLRGWPERPQGGAMRAAAEAWRPWRGAAAHFLWHFYHHMTGRAGAPLQAAGQTPPTGARSA